MDTKQANINPTDISIDVASDNSEQVQPETPERLLGQIYQFALQQHFAVARKERLEELMQRKKARTWDNAKKAKMVRRLMAVTKERQETDTALEQLKFRLSQITSGT